MMKLGIPNYTQPKRSYDCGLYCAKMLLEYYGKRVSIARMKKSIHGFKYGYNAHDIGVFLMKNGFDVTSISFTPRFFPPKMRGKKEKQKLAYLKKEIKNMSPFRAKHARAIMRFLETGGKHVSKVPTVNMIESELKKKHPPLALIDSTTLYGRRQNEAEGHMVLPIGYDAHKIYFNDPHPDIKGRKSSPKKEFEYAIHSYSGLILLVKPRK